MKIHTYISWNFINFAALQKINNNYKEKQEPMDSKLDEFKFVADLARNEGELKAKYESSQDDNIRLREENEQLRLENQRLREENERLKNQHENNSYQPQVVVNNFFLLSWPKTYNYVSALDNDDKRVVSHMLHHTVPDDTPKSVIAQIDEITSLDANPNARLADAMEDLAKKPTVQNTFGNIGNYNEHVDEQNNSFPMPPIGSDDIKKLEDE